jgi:sugar phosphate isomerase/epimerase
MHMKKTRREFLVSAGAAAVAGGALGGSMLSWPPSTMANPLGKPMGIQLYTVKDQLKDDFDGTLKQVAADGYQVVETAGFFGKTPAQVKTSFDNAGLKCPSIHIQLEGGIEEALKYATVLGSKYVIASVVFAKPAPAKFDMKTFTDMINNQTFDDYKIMAEKCNQMGEQAKKAGVQFGYHNHNFEFRKYPQGIGYDEMLRVSDPSLVKMELDCGWMVAAGHDPVEYMNKYPGRYKMLHVKDFKAGSKPSTGLDESAMPKPAELGRGAIDYKPIFAAAKKAGIEWYFIEQEPPYEDMPVMEAIKVDYDFLHKWN